MLAFYLQVRHGFLVGLLCIGLGLNVYAQSAGSSGSISGTVSDPTGAVVPNAAVEIHNPVSHFDHHRRRRKVQLPQCAL